MRELPSGRLTLLFTDVEGSTRLLHELGPDYAEALAEHRRILRRTFATHGGVEVDTQGDAFFAVFPRAADALGAALEANERLADGPIRIRAGLHTGAPERTDEGYVGVDVHLGARVAATGHGGQVVLSEAAAFDLGPDAALAELGAHRLKDFELPVRLYQSGTDEFPPLKTISNTNLPYPASSFVGRQDEVAALVQRVGGGARLVTLTGPGGSGKTRLAIEAAHELVPEMRGGAAWVGLAPVDAPELVVETIARTLGARESVAAHIGDRELLLLLDNFEHVVGAAPSIAGLVEQCPNLHVLVTSRELLRVRGEVELPVDPLGAVDAVALFSDRSGLDPGGDVGALCAALDNLPLAVELAAARTQVLSPAQILDRLGERLDLFRGARDADPRQLTLRAAIDWSHELLSPEEQALFARFAVFAGGCDLEAAEELAGAELDTLQALVEKSLVRHSGERFWMLETIREYALEQLAARSDAAELRRRHARYYADLVARMAPHLEGPDQTAALDRVEADYPNIRVALSDDELRARMVGGLAFFWAFRGYLDEGRRIARETCRESPADAAVAFAGGLLAVMQGDHEDARVHAEAARRLALAQGDATIAVHAASVLSRALLGLGEKERAVELLRSALSDSRGTGRGMSIAHLNLGYVALMDDDLDEAEASFEEAVKVARQAGDPHAEARSLAALASAALEQGRPHDVLRRARESIDASLGNDEVAVWAIELAGVALAGEEPVRAARLLGAAEAARERLGIAQTGLELRQHERGVAALGDGHADSWAAGRRLSLAAACALL